MRNDLPKLTVQELAIAEQVGKFLLPMCRGMVEQAKTTRDDATAKFCRDFAATQRAREALPDSSGPMARVELDTRLLELASAFVALHSKA